MGTSSVMVTAAVPPIFAITGSAVTVSPGATSGNTSTITVTPSGGFTGSVALTAAVTSSPTGAQDPPTFSFSSTTPVNITGASAETATLTLSTTAPISSALVVPRQPRAAWYKVAGTNLACVLVLVIPSRRRSWRTMFSLPIFFLIGAGGLTACGGPKTVTIAGNPGTTAGNYTITVTATSGATVETGNFTLTVQ